MGRGTTIIPSAIVTLMQDLLSGILIGTWIETCLVAEEAVRASDRQNAWTNFCPGG